MLSGLNRYRKGGSFRNKKHVKETKIADLVLLSQLMNNNVACNTANT